MQPPMSRLCTGVMTPDSAQAASQGQVSTCPTSTGNSLTLQSAGLPFLFPKEQFWELQTCSSSFCERAGSVFPGSCRAQKDVLRLCGSQLSVPRIRECRKGPTTYLFSLLQCIGWLSPANKYFSFSHEDAGTLSCPKVWAL